MIHLLYVVSREQITLSEYLRSRFGDEPRVTIALDRRFAERRQQTLGYPVERRSGERRRYHVEGQLRQLGWALVRLDVLADPSSIGVGIAFLEEKIVQAARSAALVLIRGERGVGKDFVARRIHALSPRQGQPFIKINCATTPLDRLQADLFGHEKGAVPEAHRRKLGKLEFAGTGTLYLDGLEALPAALERPLLNVLRERRFSRTGGEAMIPLGARVILSAMHTPAEGFQGPGEFWEELSRLNLVEIDIPPLRERPDEIPALAALFLARFNQEYQRQAQLARDTLALFQAYAWPGNVRELEDTIRRLVLTGQAE